MKYKPDLLDCKWLLKKSL